MANTAPRLVFPHASGIKLSIPFSFTGGYEQYYSSVFGQIKHSYMTEMITTTTANGVLYFMGFSQVL
jgi:hypothetical protein